MAHFSEKDLERLGLKDNGDGTFSKKKTTPQPREKQQLFATPLDTKNTYKLTGTSACETINYTPGTWRIDNKNSEYRIVSLVLFGIPMPKQSVRAANGNFWQPAEKKERTNDYIRQIKEQLPVDFKIFEHEVHVTKMHFVYPPPKYFHKIKGRMDAIRNGEIIYKNTRPDLPDNLKKLVNDAMSGLVYKDDGIIVTENDVAKYYGTGGCVIIELKGH